MITCKFWRRHSRERASQSLEVIQSIHSFASLVIPPASGREQVDARDAVVREAVPHGSILALRKIRAWVAKKDLLEIKV